MVSNWWHTCDCYFNFFQYTNLHSTLLSQKSAAHSLAHNLYSVKTNHTASAYQQNLPVNLRLHSPPKKEKLHPLEEPKRESKPRMEWKRSRRCRRQFVRSIRRRCIGRADDFIPVKGRRRVSAVEQAALYGAYAIYIRAGPAGLHARLHRYTRRVGPTPVQTGNVWREGSRTDVRPTDGRTTPRNNARVSVFTRRGRSVVHARGRWTSHFRNERRWICERTHRQSSYETNERTSTRPRQVGLANEPRGEMGRRISFRQATESFSGIN